jgi:hypothetical protein
MMTYSSPQQEAAIADDMLERYAQQGPVNADDILNDPMRKIIRIGSFYFKRERPSCTHTYYCWRPCATELSSQLSDFTIVFFLEQPY